MKDFDFENKPETLQSQYSTSNNIKNFVNIFEIALPNEAIELFYKSIFDIDTAKGVGLDIWGRIIGIGREIEVESNKGYFGFKGSKQNGFNHQAFYKKGATNVYKLQDNAYRQYLLLTKAFANISDSTAPTINYILSQLFKNKAAYVLPVGVMQIRFVFEFELTAFEKNIFNLGLLTRGAGVGYEYYQVKRKKTFGFRGQNLNTFNNGVFNRHKVTKVE